MKLSFRSETSMGWAIFLILGLVGVGWVIAIARSESTNHTQSVLPLGVRVEVMDHCEYLRPYDNKYLTHKGNCTNCIAVRLQGIPQKN